MMAIEAMACSRPVISFEGTSLPSITFAPEAGLAVRLDDNEALAAAIRHLLSHSPECELRGRRSRALAEEHYDITRQAKALASLYRDVQRRGSGASLKSSGDLVSE